MFGNIMDQLNAVSGAEIMSLKDDKARNLKFNNDLYKKMCTLEYKCFVSLI